MYSFNTQKNSNKSTKCKEKSFEANKQQCQEHLIVNTGCASDLQGGKCVHLVYFMSQYHMFRTSECKREFFALTKKQLSNRRTVQQ